MRRFEHGGLLSTNTYAISSQLRVLARDIGVNLPSALRRAGLPADWLHHTGRRVSIPEFHAFCDGMCKEIGEEALPLAVAENLRVEAFDPAMFASLCSPNLNHAACRLAQYKPILGPIRIIVDQTDTTTTITMRWPVEHPPPAGFGRMEVLWWVALARLATRTRIRPVAACGPQIADYTDYLGIEMTTAPEWSVTFSALDAARPFLTANDAMWQFFEPDLRRRLDEVTESTSTTERVRAALLELLPAGDGSMAAVARTLCTSKRTSQRRLAEENTSFQGILNETRESLARYYLENSDLPASEISFLLGYADPNSFYRAFQSWTGTTPETLRTRQAG